MTGGFTKRMLIRAFRAANRLLTRYGWELAPRLPASQPHEFRVALHDPGVMLLVGMASIRPVTIVTVGAGFVEGFVEGTGVTDPAIEFLRHLPERVARAVLIEPIPRRLAATQDLLGSAPNLSFVGCAIGASAGSMTLWQITSEANRALRGIGMRADGSGASAGHGWTSADRDHVVGLLTQALGVTPEVAERYVQRIDVPSQTLTSVALREGLDRIDYLQVDTEGFDDEVIMSLDLAVLAPSVIRCEYVHLGAHRLERLAAHLAGEGYGPPTKMGDLDAIFVRS